MTGTAALFLSSHTGAGADEVEDALKSNATTTETLSKDGQPVRLVDAGAF